MKLDDEGESRKLEPRQGQRVLKTGLPGRDASASMARS